MDTLPIEKPRTNKLFMIKINPLLRYEFRFISLPYFRAGNFSSQNIRIINTDNVTMSIFGMYYLFIYFIFDSQIEVIKLQI